MKKRYRKIIISILALLITGSFMFSLQGKPKKDYLYSQEKIFKAHFVCSEAYKSGPFQNCSLTLWNKNTEITEADILLRGGMPGHHHGLPTSPQITWSKEKSRYLIEGLKFSMPGKWILEFKIDSRQNGEPLNDILKIDIDVE